MNGFTFRSTLEWYTEQMLFSVLPLKLNDKTPSLMEWKHLQEIIPTRVTMKSWPIGNIGVVTGGVSNIIVVDCDSMDDAKWWWNQGRKTPLWVRTRRGMHFYFQHPGADVPNRAGVEGRFDVRGDGGYVVAPPSIVMGNRYRFGVDSRFPNSDSLPMFRFDWLPTAQQSNGDGTEVKQASAYVLAALKRQFDCVASAVNGTRNDTLNAAAYSLGRLVGSGSLARNVVVKTLSTAALLSGLSEHEALRTIQSGVDAGIQKPKELMELSSQ